MAVLVQLPRTGLYRAALLPVVFWMTLRASMSLDFSWNYPGYNYLNRGLALGMFIIALRCTAWVFAKWPYTRLPICKSGNAIINSQNGYTLTDHDVSSAMWNAWDLMANLRGIDWNGPQKMHIPTPYFRVESRLMFFLLSICRIICLALLFDTLCGAIRSFGSRTFGTPKGGTIFDSSVPPPERYIEIIYRHTAFRDHYIRYHRGNLPHTCGVVHDGIPAIPITVAPSFRLPFFFNFAR
ncbi:hypothetical protein J3R82DRAFT_1914 [Butyriboletus roseoflavus]|nr:hypothetical protein J3R82DRAFT_1914 [Butyriboletus roseoflavus]